MTLDPRRIALQGIGSAALAIALQGFSATALLPPPVYASSGGGGFSKNDSYHDWRAELAETAESQRIHAQNQLIVSAVMAAMAQGLFQ